jgi:RHS repeat-associated protein
MTLVIQSAAHLAFTFPLAQAQPVGSSNFSFQLTAAGGSGSYVFSGTPPSGWTLSSSGIVTPSNTVLAQTGTTAFPVSVNDGSTTQNATLIFTFYDLYNYTQYMIDKNGNTVSLDFEWEITEPVSTATLTDDENRTISFDSNWTVNATGFNNTALQWTVARNSLTSTESYYEVDLSGASQTSVLPTIPVVTSLTLPAALGGGSYSFDYNGTPGSAFTSTTPNSGELRTLTLPSGATSAYTYSWDMASKPFAPQNSVPNVVASKTVQFNGQTQEHWTYNITPGTGVFGGHDTGSSIIVGPDGGVTTEIDYNGVAVETIMPDGTTIDKVWMTNNPYSSSNGVISYNYVDPSQLLNPYVAYEYRSVASGTQGACSSSVACLTAITHNTADPNGNTLTSTEYEFIPYSSLTRGSDGQPTTTGGTVRRVTTNTYAAPTSPVACTSSSTVYCSANAPATGKSIESTAVSNGSTTAAYTEYTYDNPTGTANLTQVAKWDSTLNPSVPSGYPSLSSSNAVLTQSSYISTTNLAGNAVSGILASTTDANGVVTAYTYTNVCGVPDLYPSSVTQASGTGVAETTTYTNYDCGTGVVGQRTDPNNAQSTMGYDAVGRMTQLTVDGNTLFSRTIHDPAPSDPSVYTISQTHLDSTNSKVVMQCWDPIYRLGRTQLLEAAQPGSMACTQTNGIVTDRAYAYGSNGSYNLVSNPYRSTSDSTMGWTLTTLDTIGRTTSVASYLGAAQPAPFASNSTTSGAVTSQYSLDTTNLRTVTTVADQNGIYRVNSSDVLGRLVTVGENGSYSTQYAYDILNDLTTVSQTNNAGAVTRNFTYSSLGRLLTADNPETRYGSQVISYGYDHNGNLTSRTDTRQVTTMSSYDPLNRIISKTYNSSGTPLQAPNPASLTPSVAYCYDGNITSNGVPCNSSAPAANSSTGELTAVSSTASTTSYTYNDLKQIIGSTQTTGGNAYPFTYTYNFPGTLSSITYPNSGRLVTFPYDVAGRTTGAIGLSGGAGGVTTNYAAVPSPTGFAANGAIATLNLSNAAMTESTGYNARFQPLTIQAAFGSTTLLSLQYSYCSNYADVNASQTCSSNNGNLWQQAITFPAIGTAASFSETQQYQYNDPSNRITQAATSNSSWIQQFGYDATGNGWVATNSNLPALTQEAPVAQSWFTAANRISGWTYDETGNILQIGTTPSLSRIFTYDAENRQITATINGGTPSSYVYDGEGRRVQATTASGTTTFVYDAAGRLAQEYSTAAPTDTGTSYMFADHLGSTRLITDGSGDVKKRFDYLPFGEEILASYGSRTSAMGYNTGVGTPDIERLKFTGKERDAESGLDYMEARYYGSSMGRMMSPDPVFISIDRIRDPQGLNLYAYARNNPLSITDPTGLDFYQTCTSTKDNGDTCQQVQNGSSKVWVQGTTDSNGFTANRIANDADGNLVDTAHGNAAVSGTFDESGVHLNGAQGQFIDGSAQTNINGSGIFSGIQGQFVSDCGGSCQGRAELVGSDQALAAMEGALHRQGGLTSALDLLSGAHNPGTQWKDSDGSIHVILNGAGTLNAGKTEMHFEGHPTGVDVQQFVLHMVDTIRDATSGRAAAEKSRVLP